MDGDDSSFKHQTPVNVLLIYFGYLINNKQFIFTGVAIVIHVSSKVKGTVSGFTPTI